MTRDNDQEMLPLVDPDGNVIGKATRGECHNGSHLLHPVVHLHVFNTKGELYLQKRPEWKDIQPGKWDTAVGGHVDLGENIEHALCREAREELGIEIGGYKPLLTYVFRSEREDELVHAFSFITDMPVRPSEETDSGRFWSIQEIQNAIGKNILTPNFEQEFTLLFGDACPVTQKKIKQLMKKNLETICIHGGWKAGKGEPQQLPIYQSTTFRYETSDQMARLFDLKDSGYFYTRLANPTNDAVAKKIAALEGGIGAVLTCSGQAANFFAIINICQAGDHFITSNNIYGGTFNLFGVTLKKMGIECTFIDQDWDDERIEAEFRPNTKCFFGETISNPGGRIFDIERFAKMAHKHGVPLVVDNTFATPINCRPFEWGADIVTHSTTKYMDGHASQVGGCVVDSGNFDWESQHDKYTCLTEPDESYHGLTYTTSFGKMAFITKLIVQLMRDLGSIPAPQNSFLLNIGLETLALRMRQHCANALKVAEWLKKNEKVGWVSYASLPDDRDHALAQKYLPDGTCGVIAFGLKGSREEAIRFMDNLEFISIVTHVADARTCVLHPASHTHRQLSEEQLREAGISPDLVRLSVGIENVDDIIADLSQAMDKM